MTAMNKKVKTIKTIETSQTIGPEDLRRGDYVAVTDTIYELVR